MKELLEHIVKSIVNQPDSVEITEKESSDFPGLTILSIKVAEEDKGVVIGRRGRTINAIRDIMTINAIRSDARVKVVVEDDERREPRAEKESKVSDEPEQEVDMLEDEI